MDARDTHVNQTAFTIIEFTIFWHFSCKKVLLIYIILFGNIYFDDIVKVVKN